MNKSLNMLIYRSMFVAVAIIGFFRSLCIFRYQLDFTPVYTMYTYLSNYLITVFMLVAFAVNVRAAKRDQLAKPIPSFAPHLNFYAVIAILVTFLVANIVLENMFTPVFWDHPYFDNILLHVVTPVMFIVDWFVFCEHGRLRWFDPLLCTVFPLCYIGFIFIRAAVFPNAKNLYPYFFLDVKTLGVQGVAMWIGILLAVFIVLGYVFFAIDRFILGRKSA